MLMCRTENNTQLYVYKSANILQPVKAVNIKMAVVGTLIIYSGDGVWCVEPMQYKYHGGSP